MPPGNRKITEDDPRWDPRTMGNKKYGPGAKFPSNAGGTHTTAKKGTGPGPKGSYPNVSRAAGKRLTEDSGPAKWTSAKTGGNVSGPLNRMVPGDTRKRGNQRNS